MTEGFDTAKMSANDLGDAVYVLAQVTRPTTLQVDAAVEAINELVDRAEAAAGMVMVSRESAGLISRAFLPLNPRKMRPALPELVAAVDEFRAALRTATAKLP